jgi:glycosyltransferase involved in cell wall biosynthesis
MKIFINPTYVGADQADGGIRRVVEAQIEFFPRFGHSVVSSARDADVIINHGTLRAESPSALIIAHCHGAYWEEYTWPSWALEANRRIAENFEIADHLVVTSRWVQRAIARGVCLRSTVIYHGVRPEEWEVPSSPGSYLLWNKSRTDPVADDTVVAQLAVRLPKREFVTTFCPRPLPNVRQTGTMSYGEMKKFVQQAGVYLATTRETFGIGTLEALASGVPVVGWRFGGQEEIIIPGETGELVEYGDYDGLVEAIEKVFAHRSRYSRAARQDVESRWGWEDKIEAYSQLLETLSQRRHGPKVSVVITNYNLGRFLGDAVSSVLEQEFSDPRGIELIIVDDGSTDEDSLEVLSALERRDDITVYRLPQNVGLPLARNVGAYLAHGEYLMFLDADDLLERFAIQRLVDVLDRHRNLHITYGGIDITDETLSSRRPSPWPRDFSWVQQMSHLNQLPYAALWRREAFLWTGGYRERDWRAEDASLWCRATSYGLRAARGTESTTLIYRLRRDSKTQVERAIFSDSDGDWTAWYPWRTGASNAQEGEKLADPRRISHALVPFGAPRLSNRPWPIRHLQEPAVSVIIPVGPGHGRYLVDCLDSLLAQTLQQWEAIVVVDGDPVATSVLLNYVWADVVVLDNPPRGAGRARNVGIKRARAPLLVFLDADDILHPRALERFLQVYVEHQGYVYSDCQSPRDPKKLDGGMIYHPAADYDRKLFLSSGYRLGSPGRHSVTCLVAREDALAVGGFDEDLDKLEDWEFYLRLAVHGVCGHRIPEPLLTYRLHTGTRRPESGTTPIEFKILEERYSSKVSEGDMPCSCGSGGDRAVSRARMALSEIQSQGTQTSRSGFWEADPVLLEYVGDQFAPVVFRGPISRRSYRAGREQSSRIVQVDPRDVDGLLRTGQFARYSNG